jgi:hypothetical protein
MIDINDCPELKRLVISAEASCEWRGHSMAWHLHSNTLAEGECQRCGKDVMCNTKPQANEIDIGGPAVALECNR